MAVTEVLDVVVAGEDTVFLSDDTGDEVAISIGIGDALLVDDTLCLR